MPRPNQNIPVANTDIPARLVKLRTAKNISQAQLAKKAGLTYRTVHDLEMGRRKKVMEKTLMLISEALDVPVTEILHDTQKQVVTPAPTGGVDHTHPAAPRHRNLAMGTITLLAIAMLSTMVIHRARATSTWTIDGKVLQTEYGLSHLDFWRAEYRAQINFCRTAPWSDQELIVGLGTGGADGALLIGLDRTSGDELWSINPDFETLIAAFGTSDFEKNKFACTSNQRIDLDGDGTPELLVQFTHLDLKTSCLCVVNASGDVIGRYANKGTITRAVVADVDGQPGDEVIASGTNESSPYHSATVFMLNQNHFSGATVDSVSFPTTTVRDGSVCRLIFPQFDAPYHDIFDGETPTATVEEMQQSPQGKTTIVLQLNYNEDAYLILFADSTLNITSCVASDSFRQWTRHHQPHIADNQEGPLDSHWRWTWLNKTIRIDRGQRAPFQQISTMAPE